MTTRFILSPPSDNDLQGSDMFGLDTALMALKYIATALTGLAGLWGISSSSDEPEVRKLNKRVAFVSALVALLIALASQAGEQILSYRASVAAKKDRETLISAENATEQQLEDSMKKRAELNQLAAQFAFEVPASDPDVQRLIASIELARQKSARSFFAGIITTDPAVYIYPTRVFDRDLLAALDPLVLHFRELPKNGVIAITLSLPAAAEPNLIARITNPQIDALSFCYVRAALGTTGRLYARWATPPIFAGASGAWNSDGKITSINNLTNVEFDLVIYLNLDPKGQSFQYFAHLRPPLVTAIFGNYQCSLHNFDFKPYPIDPKQIVYRTILPDTASILADNAFRPEAFELRY